MFVTSFLLERRCLQVCAQLVAAILHLLGKTAVMSSQGATIEAASFCASFFNVS